MALALLGICFMLKPFHMLILLHALGRSEHIVSFIFHLKFCVSWIISRIFNCWLIISCYISSFKKFIWFCFLTTWLNVLLIDWSLKMFISLGWGSSKNSNNISCPNRFVLIPSSPTWNGLIRFRNGVPRISSSFKFLTRIKGIFKHMPWL